MTSKPTQTAVIPEDGRLARDGDVTWAISGYLGTVFLGPAVPLVVYLTRGGKSPFLRQHAATAANLALTGTLYALCCLIIGGLLMLDSLTVALAVAVPLGFALGVALLRNLIRGAAAAGRREPFEAPAWIFARRVG
jgi:hypothetical protein